MKKRPMNDPIILHVSDFSMAIANIFSLDDFETNIVKLLSDKFSPGPLTIVAKAKESIPKILSNNTGFQGVRVPSHTLARELLQYIKFPLAAPSANLFGHISPTRASHVLNEFPSENIYIIEGGCSSIGIESTVVKLCKTEDIYTLSICRPGAITFDMICDVLVGVKGLKIVNHGKFTNSDGSSKIYSPGQLLTHYSPKHPTILLKHETTSSVDLKGAKIENGILFDISGVFAKSKSVFAHYIPPFDGFADSDNNYMSSCDKVALLQQNLFANLRKSEELACHLNNPIIFISWFSKTLQTEALYDRVYRAASGQIKDISEFI